MTARDVVIDLEVGLNRFVAQLPDRDAVIEDVQPTPGRKHLAAHRPGLPANALRELAVH